MKRVQLWQVCSGGLLEAFHQELLDQLLLRDVGPALQVAAKVTASLGIRDKALQDVTQTSCVPLVKRLILV